MNRSMLAAAVLALVPLSSFAAASFGEAELSSAFAASRGLVRAAAPVSPAHWLELIAKVRALGTFTPTDGNIPDTYGLADVRGPKDAAHVADYVNEWGFTDSRGEFQPGEVTLVSEQWTIPADGNWHVDQWLFRLGMDGSVGARAHITLVETQDGQVLADDGENLKDGDPRVQAKYDALLNLWNGWQPRPKAEKDAVAAPAFPRTGATAARLAKSSLSAGFVLTEFVDNYKWSSP
ncbi:MAG TPA: hypothetical protein VN915_05505 [Elusimicrobiota bacterium]|nr:hypothetical protein [Elusimicrobiota bacterium]